MSDSQKLQILRDFLFSQADEALAGRALVRTDAQRVVDAGRDIGSGESEGVTT